MTTANVLPARGEGHIPENGTRGKRVLIPPPGAPLKVGLCHERFLVQWLHFDTEARRDVPHFCPDSACPYCHACGYYPPRCFYHIGASVCGVRGPSLILKLTDTAFEHCPDLRELHRNGELRGHCALVSRTTGKKNGGQKIELAADPRVDADWSKMWSLDVAVEHLYKIPFHQQIAERFAAAMR